jgi:hypothetical protein
LIDGTHVLRHEHLAMNELLYCTCPENSFRPGIMQWLHMVVPKGSFLDSVLSACWLGQLLTPTVPRDHEGVVCCVMSVAGIFWLSIPHANHGPGRSRRPHFLETKYTYQAERECVDRTCNQANDGYATENRRSRIVEIIMALRILVALPRPNACCSPPRGVW